MTFITQNAVSSLIEYEVVKDIFTDVTDGGSECLKRMTRLPDMNAKQDKLNVSSSLPTVYWRTGATGASQPAARRQTAMEWEGVYLTAETMDAVVGIPEEQFDDAGYPMWDQCKPLIADAISALVDETILHGTSAPTSFPDDVVTAATAASMTVALGAIGDIYDDLYGDGGVCHKVWANGYDVDASIGAVAFKAQMTGARGTDDAPLFPELHRGGSVTVAGSPVVFPLNGSVDQTALLLAAGMWRKLVYAIRKDVYYRVLDQATITDPITSTTINFAQNGLIGLMVTFRMGWQRPNPVNRMQSDDDLRYPIAILTPAAGS